MATKYPSQSLVNIGTLTTNSAVQGENLNSLDPKIGPVSPEPVPCERSCNSPSGGLIAGQSSTYAPGRAKRGRWEGRSKPPTLVKINAWISKLAPLRIIHTRIIA